MTHQICATLDRSCHGERPLETSLHALHRSCAAALFDLALLRKFLHECPVPPSPTSCASLFLHVPRPGEWRMADLQTQAAAAWLRLREYAVTFDFQQGVQPLSSWQAPAVRGPTDGSQSARLQDSAVGAPPRPMRLRLCGCSLIGSRLSAPRASRAQPRGREE